MTRADPRDPTVIFLHIGKTAGSTMRRILRRQFSQSQVLDLTQKIPDPTYRLRREGMPDLFAAMPETERARPRLIMAHTIYGLHEHVPRPSTYVTLLRDPVKLVISLYGFILRRPGHRIFDEVAGAELSLEEFVRSGVSLEADNSQVRALAGDRTAAFGEVDDAMLERAKAHIEERVRWLGFVERFDDGLVALQRTFGWTNTYYIPVNVAASRSRTAPDPAVIEAIRDQNRFDIELYRWANERMDRLIAEDPGFEAARERFLRLNRLYRAWGHLSYTIPRKVHDRVVGPKASTASS
jgi:hypothetical protein